MAEEKQNGCLVVGEGVTLSGSFVVPNSASISGRIDGDLTAREILVGTTGVLRGKVIADLIDVRGEVHESITSHKALFVRATGKVTGTVQYAEIEIEKGGDLQGSLSKSAAVSKLDSVPKTDGSFKADGSSKADGLSKADSLSRAA